MGTAECIMHAGQMPMRPGDRAWVHTSGDHLISAEVLAGSTLKSQFVKQALNNFLVYYVFFSNYSPAKQ